MDETLRPDTVRVSPLLVANLSYVEDVYFIRRNDVYVIINYVREIGLRRTLAKVISRRRERYRNLKALSVGIGVVEGPADVDIVGRTVLFVAPMHPLCFDRAVIARALVREYFLESEFRAGHVAHVPVGGVEIGGEDLTCLLGWTIDSGREISTEEAIRALAVAEEAVRQATSLRPTLFRAGSGVREHTEHTLTEESVHRGCLIGYGNYAKSVVLPALRGVMDVCCCHEIDPSQIGPVGYAPGWDTAPDLTLRDAHHNAFFIASFHHTHAALAIAAIRLGAPVLVEKPIVTSLAQLAELENVLTETGGRVWAGFHKRYSPFNRYAFSDLRTPEGGPVSLNCVVYEVPLPEKHWYKWPNSGSRLLSNGCHWTDQFLFFNSFAEVISTTATSARNGDIFVTAELVNGASFSMALTSRGSTRLGLQNYVELRSMDRTVRIVNDSAYMAEDSRKVLRRARCNRLDGHRMMYRTVADAMKGGVDADSFRSIEASCALILSLECGVDRGNGEA